MCFFWRILCVSRFRVAAVHVIPLQPREHGPKAVETSRATRQSGKPQVHGTCLPHTVFWARLVFFKNSRGKFKNTNVIPKSRTSSMCTRHP